MGQQQASRTRAKRGWAVNTFWAAWLILLASAIVAAGMIEATPLVAVWAVAAAAGLVSGLLLGWRTLSRVSLVRAIGTPVAVAVPLAVLGIGLSQTEEDVAVVAGGLASLFAIWEGSTLAGYAVTSRRSREETVGAPIASTLDRELEAATAGATIPVVMREYVDDDDGQRHLARDTDALSAHGYHVVSVERAIRGSAVADLLSGGSTYEEQIVATFRLDRGEDDGSIPFVMARQARHHAQHPRNVLWTALEVVLIIGWVLIGIVGTGVVAAAIVAVTGTTETGTNLGAGLFLGAMALATLASFLTHRWFSRHYT